MNGPLKKKGEKKVECGTKPNPKRHQKPPTPHKHTINRDDDLVGGLAVAAVNEVAEGGGGLGAPAVVVSESEGEWCP